MIKTELQAPVISVDLLHHEIFHAKVGKGIIPVVLISRSF